MTGGILESHFAHAVESGPFGHRDFVFLQRSENRVEILDLDVEEGRAFFRGFGDLRHVVAETGKRLIHHLGAVFLQRGETEFVAVRNLDCFLKAERVDPERQHRLDLLHEQYWSDSLYLHRKSPLALAISSSLN